MFDTIHYHIGNSDKQYKKIIKLLTMAQETLDQLLSRVDSLDQRLTNISDDITRIKEGLPQSGGLSAYEVETLRARLDAVVTKATELDEANEPEGESPVTEEPTEPQA